jgi:hypothetical protein
VAREVGTEGKLGGQAERAWCCGYMERSDRFRKLHGIQSYQPGARYRKSGNLGCERKPETEINDQSFGEVSQLTDTINEMIDTLAIFADQVTTVAREVGVDGKLGGQASVPGASGTWKNLTENVNQLAENLTTQVRSISEVASAVTKGDLTR